MFRSATTRIAHNSTVPVLAGISKDLKSLQDLINAEKSVLHSLQKLAVDLAKASEALKQWGNGEGDDLGDTLTACTSLLLHFASALSRVSAHEGTVREHMKAIRSREEHFDELKRKRKALMSKADSADKKLSKMSAENKNFQSQADTLNKLRDEIRVMDTEIMNEEASLGDFKRSSAKQMMGVKFGALQECCEKGAAVSELGKLVIAEIPLFPTEPGLPRPYYTGHARTDFLVAEAQRVVGEVQYSTEPNPHPSVRSILPIPTQEFAPAPVHPSRRESFQPPGVTQSNDITSSSPVRHSIYSLSPGTHDTGGFMTLPDISQSSTGCFGLGSYLSSDLQQEHRQSPPPVPSREGNPFASPRPPSLPLSTDNISEFGTYSSGSQYAPRTSSLRGPAEPASPTSPRSGRFATFPVKGAAGPRPPPNAYTAPPPLEDRPPSLELNRGNSTDFSNSVAEALGKQWPATEAKPRISIPSTKTREALENTSAEFSPPPPQYSLMDEPASGSAQESHNQNQSPFGDPSAAGTSSMTPQTIPEEDEGAELAYMSASNDEHDEPDGSDKLNGPGHLDRRVHFGSIRDIDTEMDKRQSAEIPEAHRVIQPTNTTSQTNGLDSHGVGCMYGLSGSSAYTGPQVFADNSGGADTPSQTVTTVTPQISLPPTPPIQPPPAPIPTLAENHHNDIEALNVAAAREVARELDALMFSTPTLPPEPPLVSTPPLSLPQSPRTAHSFSRTEPPAPIETPASPTFSARNEPTYVRQRDRSPSVPASPVSERGLRATQQPQLMTSITSSPIPDEQPLPPPPPLSAIPPRSSSPTLSSLSAGTPFRTPPEYPTTQPVGPGSFYNLPSLSSSGSFSPGGTRTISAAVFKRQIRSASTNSQPPAPEPTVLSGETSPLNVKKRGSSPLSSPNLPAAEFSTSLRAVSSPIPTSLTPEAQLDKGYRPSPLSQSPPSDINARRSMARFSRQPGDYGDDDDFDYISAYVDNSPIAATYGSDVHGPHETSNAGYGQGRYATNLEDGHGSLR